MNLCNVNYRFVRAGLPIHSFGVTEMTNYKNYAIHQFAHAACFSFSMARTNTKVGLSKIPFEHVYI